MQTVSRQSLQSVFEIWGTVTEIAAGEVKLAGVSSFARVGDEIRIASGEDETLGEVLRVTEAEATALLYETGSAVTIGDRAYVHSDAAVRANESWLGKIVNHRGEITGASVQQKTTKQAQPLYTKALPAHQRRGLGTRLSTGLMATDTLMPICRGQRVGLFAGSGVGKSTLLTHLGKTVEADRVVIGLIGERSREVNEFARRIFEDAKDKTVIVAATASESPGAKKRAAYCAMATAEYFRDQGHHTLLLFDSLTRFAEAHREIALMAGEAPAINAFPPSTIRVISELVERAGPGNEATSDITAIFSVLVAGSDMEEPLADMIRGILDGHLILSREIAERGRYPALDAMKSVSRALPAAATDEQNQLIRDCRHLISMYDEVAPMLRANLYEFGRDQITDRAIHLFHALDTFIGAKNAGSVEDGFDELAAILNGAPANAD
ncbi:MAG: flagellum-specific ATP synthase FliI [Pseudomonadota bacterium]